MCLLFCNFTQTLSSMISFLDHDFTALNQYLTHQRPSKIFFLVDENTHEYCLPVLLGNMATEVPYEIIEIESGEDAKTVTTAVQLWEILAEFEADRKALFINLGGGVITDLGGFVASTYKRGIKFINIPTTLLAMCDASIGGKTGLDHSFLKNIIGTFAEADQIWAYPGFLKTLPFSELRSGFAEMLKHGLIADAAHWEDLIKIEQLTPEALAPYIERSMKIKQEVVEKDFREQNLRKTLNFGHTIGHAVESLFLKTGNLIPHGEAVALGMIMETRLSFLENLIPEETACHIVENLRRFYPYVSIQSFSNDAILQLMFNDKKNENEAINFSLLEGIGRCNFDHKVNPEHLEKALDFYRNLQA